MYLIMAFAIHRHTYTHTHTHIYIYIYICNYVCSYMYVAIAMYVCTLVNWPLPFPDNSNLVILSAGKRISENLSFT